MKAIHSLSLSSETLSFKSVGIVPCYFLFHSLNLSQKNCNCSEFENATFIQQHYASNHLFSFFWNGKLTFCIVQYVPRYYLNFGTANFFSSFICVTHSWMFHKINMNMFQMCIMAFASFLFSSNKMNLTITF